VFGNWGKKFKRFATSVKMKILEENQLMTLPFKHKFAAKQMHIQSSYWEMHRTARCFLQKVKVGATCVLRVE
jgi:hypothetical protein